jgi:hypothetical protein
MALLPGSPALDAGVVAGQSTDQRGDPRVIGSAADIGAFESHGFTFTYVSGSKQITATGAAFAAPLVGQVTSNNPLEPVAGGVVTFQVPASGATARLRTVSAVIGSQGTVTVLARANSVFGLYSVTAFTGGAPGTVTFDLCNGTVPQVVHVLIGQIRSLIATNGISMANGMLLINTYLKQITGTGDTSLIQAFLSKVQSDFDQGLISQRAWSRLTDDANLIQSIESF